MKWSYLQEGAFSEIRFESLFIDGQKISGVSEEGEAIEDGKLWFIGEAKALSFD